MTDPALTLTLPDGLTARQAERLHQVAASWQAAEGDNLLGLVLSGSAGRGMATEHSDLDVHIVLAGGAPPTNHGDDVDEIPETLDDLEAVPTFGSPDWWFRWSFAWAPVIADRTGGRIQRALLRQATVTDDEAESILVEHDRLDGWLNYAFRALKNDRDGRALERRLDAAESMPWLLDVVFSLAGRVRPYHKYLPWELREHPIPAWPADDLLAVLEAKLDGDPAAIRWTFSRVDALCRSFDTRRELPTLGPVIDAWGDQLALFGG